ncbi:MAG TPA: HdeD family acid-resistance protein [Nitrospiraceae bacterium]|nr:HdeD family acid-resistance protein [Nitrospiraceae bacterium]
MSYVRLLDQLAKNWGWIALRGAAAVIFGVLAFAWPGVTLVVLALFFGAYAFLDGIFALIAAYKGREGRKAVWSLVLVGVLGLAAGVATFLWPEMTALALLMFIAVWALLIGIFQIAAAIRLRKEIENEWLLGFSGALSVLFGVLMIASPGAGALAVVWIIAGYSIVFGLLLIALGFRLRKLANRTERRVGASA